MNNVRRVCHWNTLSKRTEFNLHYISVSVFLIEWVSSITPFTQHDRTVLSFLLISGTYKYSAFSILWVPVFCMSVSSKVMYLYIEYRIQSKCMSLFARVFQALLYCLSAIFLSVLVCVLLRDLSTYFNVS
jgi:hypothetical protein